MKKLLGWAMVASLFGALIAVLVITGGLKAAIISVAGAFGILTFIVVAVMLILGDL